jgi:hypothetical protein
MAPSNIEEAATATSTADLSLAFFNSTIMLYRITSQALSKLYNNNLENDPVLETATGMTETLCQIVTLERKMELWASTLDPALQLIMLQQGLPAADLTRWQEAKFRVILTLRYHNLNILINRPVLAQALSGEDPSGSLDVLPTSLVASAVVRSTLDSGLRSAAHIITLVHAITHAEGRQRFLLGAWWFTLYYSKSCACIE